MKKTFSILILFLVIHTYSQNEQECKKKTELFFHLMKNKKIDSTAILFAKNFTIANQKQPIANKVLRQLVNKLKLQSFDLIKVSKKPLIFNYSVVYENLGRRKATFQFNKQNQIEKIELLQIKVKKFKNTEKKIKFNSSNFIEIPFLKMRKLIIVKAMLNGIERDFILDSGSANTILNSKYLKKTNEKTLNNMKGVTSNKITGINIKKANLNFYGSEIVQQEMLTYNLAHLEKGNKKIYGLIGYDFLRKYDVLYDYKHQKITLINPYYFNTFKVNNFKNETLKAISIEQNRHFIILPITITGNVYKMVLDTGAESNLIDKRHFSKLQPNLKRIKVRELKGLSKEKLDVKSSVLKKFYLGDKKFRNTRTLFNSIEHLNRNKTTDIDGIIGYELLSKEKFIVSSKRKKIYIVD